MGARFRLWWRWQQIKQRRVTIIVVPIILVVTIALIIVSYQFNTKSPRPTYDSYYGLGQSVYANAS